MKLSFLSIGVLSLSLLACGAGGSSSGGGSSGSGNGSTATYLPAGTYTSNMSLISTNCPNFNLTGTSGITSNGSGQVCSPSNNGEQCLTVNLANNPCVTQQTSQGTVTYNNCKLTPTGMTAIVNGNLTTLNCSFSATATFIQEQDSGTQNATIEHRDHDNNFFGGMTQSNNK